ncbi:MAG: MBL fold metallo-hydrolase [Labilithrix sp.]|nr:MBL fold metallo-hydrolase [Labilithrix sp.]
MTHARYTIDCDVLPAFTAAYLRVGGDECAFIETHTALAVPKLLAALEARGRRPEDVRWIVVTHAHLDHAAGAGTLLGKCPNATLLAHPRAARHLVDPTKLVASATKVYGAARFAELYGAIDPIPEERVRALDDGATFELGGATLSVHHTAGHAKHHFIVFDPTLQTVYTGDTFGLVYPALQRGARFAIATTSPTDFDAAEARKSIDKVLSLGAKAACLTHFDEVRDLDEVGAQVRAWVDRSEAWLERAASSGETLEAMTKSIETSLREAIADDASRRGLALGEADWKLLATDIDLNAQGIAFSANKKRALTA